MRDIMNTPKDFGHNKWVYLNSEGLAYSSTYLQAIQDGIRSGTYKLFRSQATDNFTHFLNNGVSHTYMTPTHITNTQHPKISSSSLFFGG